MLFPLDAKLAKQPHKKKQMQFILFKAEVESQNKLFKQTKWQAKVEVYTLLQVATVQGRAQPKNENELTGSYIKLKQAMPIMQGQKAKNLLYY